jgi:ketosteroid isomerase-like protein
MATRAESIAYDFLDAVNRQDLDRMSALMLEDHVLVDSLGREVRGRPAVLEAWGTYFRWMPDYRIEILHSGARGALVALFGVARGTYAPDGRPSSESRWEVQAAAGAVVSRKAVSVWQVYADNKPVYEILSRGSEGKR